MNIRKIISTGLIIGALLLPGVTSAQEASTFFTTTYHNSLLIPPKTSQVSAVLEQPDSLSSSNVTNAENPEAASPLPSLPGNPQLLNQEPVAPSQPDFSASPVVSFAPNNTPGTVATQNTPVQLPFIPQGNSPQSKTTPSSSNFSIIQKVTNFINGLQNRFNRFFRANSQPIQQYKTSY